ncbi:TatD family hydrolase [Aestuariicella sp. G3-2]|uniref:TatD family hydrolase n=1 Tax=Pseudomaricurvus albidus TaxID=2842452 RepID=UPI001C0BFF9D|nr:TatD family hydrolase [Aestuariicella albida]MBU3070603.1 TatD family hydrolase [Aestuariicella albida]
MIDSHCHFDFEVFDDGRSETLQQCAAAGVDGVLIPGTHPGQWASLLALVAQPDLPCKLWAAVGWHPWWVADSNADVEREDHLNEHGFKERLAHHLGSSSVVAIGECGLDGSLDTPVDKQLPVFEWQLQLAEAFNLPLILHAHKAHNEVLQQLSRFKPAAGGVIHGFSGSLELAQQYWRLGFYLGVGGTITYERAKKTRRAIAGMPLDSLLLETDAPDMPLSGFQGQPNTPLRLPLVAQCLADLKELPLTEIQKQTDQNTRQIFALS